jgi:hypothetical protein
MAHVGMIPYVFYCDYSGITLLLRPILWSSFALEEAGENIQSVEYVIIDIFLGNGRNIEGLASTKKNMK